MNKLVSIKKALEMQGGSQVEVAGWVRSIRGKKTTSFVDITDGSTAKPLQIVVSSTDEVRSLGAGASVRVRGTLSPAPSGDLELQAEAVEVAGRSSTDYPIQKKKHGLEFLRTVPHLRPRTSFFGAVFRARSAAKAALTQALLRRDFLQLDSPVLTSLDCEGAGETFSLGEAFFGSPVYLSVSGQLHAEMVASSLSRVFTFGPTFRADPSHSRAHLAEFWMLEPEMAWADLDVLLSTAEHMFTEATGEMLQKHASDLEETVRMDESRRRDSHFAMLEATVRHGFRRITYTEAIAELQKAELRLGLGGVPWADSARGVQWGDDLRKDQEVYLVEHVAEGMVPLAVTNYPQALKPFYMRVDDSPVSESRTTVAAMDVLLPHLGEGIGGSVREERLDVLERRMVEARLPLDRYAWYLDLRRYGSVPHAGFGLGFERYLQWVAGIENIRDTVLVPRSMHSCPL